MLLRNGTEVKRQEEERKREREKSCTTYEVLCVVCLCFVNVKGVLIQTGERETESRINRTESTDLILCSVVGMLCSVVGKRCKRWF